MTSQTTKTQSTESRIRLRPAQTCSVQNKIKQHLQINQMWRSVSEELCRKCTSFDVLCFGAEIQQSLSCDISTLASYCLVRRPRFTLLSACYHRCTGECSQVVHFVCTTVGEMRVLGNRHTDNTTHSSCQPVFFAVCVADVL